MPKPNSSTLTYEQVSELLSYDPLTGDLYWKHAGPGRKPGLTAGYRHHKGYTDITIDRHGHRAHRVAWLLSYGTWPSGHIDHINGVRDDNRLANLRAATREVNAQNLHSARTDSQTGVLGVGWHAKAGKFRARIRANGKRVELGYFSDTVAAHAAYLEAKRRLHEGNML